ncbi:MAG: xanthine dehydrogenase family protein molybdopterin-binding subunit [Chloroflexi bacterium]|nr:xanthine dehydrogenase family protein molybdopterin-binding subunit [Chloroflexota bacterium]
MTKITSSIIGERLPKLDAPSKALGEATYGHDVRLPGMLQGRILYSDYPSARIINIDITRAIKVTGVKAILTAEDNPPTRFGYGKDNTPFKGQVVRSMRDEVAGVVAVDQYAAEEALSLIKVDYEPLLSIFTAKAAMEEGAPLIHPEHGSNLFHAYNYNHGDIEKGLAESDVVVETSFRLPYVSHACMETSVIIAQFDHRGQLTLWSTTQIPSLLQRDLSEALGIPGNKIRIIQTTIGGAFGRGLDIYPYEPIAALMALKVGKPVRIAFSRQEEFLAAPVRQPVEVSVRAGANQAGILTFRDVNATLDIGAYVSWGSVTPLVMMETTASLYRIPHVNFKADCVYTNNPVTGAVRGYGNPQSTFFVETVMDQLAVELDIDPVEFRLRNSNLPNTETPQGLIITSCGMQECLEAVFARADKESDAKNHIYKDLNLRNKGIHDSTKDNYLKRGIGFATTLNVGGGARIYRSDGCGATVKVDDFGHVTLITGATEIGQGSETVLAQIVAKTLGVKFGDVAVINSDTDVKPWDVGVHASRTTFIAGNAARIASLDARDQIFETAAEILETNPSELVSREGLIMIRENEQRSESLERVVRRRHFQEGGKVVIGEGWYDPPTEQVDKNTYKGNISAAYGFGAQMAEVEVDIETGMVRVIRLVCANDVGLAINPMAVEGQIEGGAQMGLGYALTEELIVKDGEVLNPHFSDYRLFTSADMPDIETIIVETDDPEGPFGAKGVGEMGGTPTAAAIANAVFDAVGVRITELPITPERLLAALDNN